jgi:hypothetical protein
VVMPAHRRSKNGVVSFAYVGRIHVSNAVCEPKTWVAGTAPAMTSVGSG